MKQAIPIHEYHSGTAKPVLHTKSANIGVLICFESLFTKLRPDPNSVDFFVVLSNLQWLSKAGTERYFLLTKLKAAETNQTWIIVANGGMSSFLLPSFLGIQDRKLKEEQVLEIYPNKEIRPYEKYGLLITFAILGLCVFAEFFARRHNFVQQTKI